MNYNEMNAILNALSELTFSEGFNYLVSLNFLPSFARWRREDMSRPNCWSVSCNFYSPDRTATVKFYTCVSVFGRKPSDSDILIGDWRAYSTPLSENPGERPA